MRETWRRCYEREETTAGDLAVVVLAEAVRERVPAAAFDGDLRGLVAAV